VNISLFYSLKEKILLLLILLILTLPCVAFSAQVTFSNVTSFGKIDVGTSKSLSFIVKNTGTKNIRLDSFWFNNTTSYNVIGGTCSFLGFTLRASKSCTVTVAFIPATAGVFNGGLTIGYFLGTGWTWGEAGFAISGEGVSKVTPPTLSWLKVSGNQILDPLGNQVILKGVNIADPEHLDTKTWERPNTSVRSIASMATDQYFAEVVRLPILPGNTTYPNEGFLNPTNGYDLYFQNHILPVVTDLTSKGKYVIIDLHYVSDYNTLYPKVKEFWTYMAPKFKDNPYVIYEIFNEPIYPNDWSTWKTIIAQPATDLIRSMAPNNLILIGGPNWSSNMSGAATNPITGTNLVYVAHVYSNQTPAMWETRYGALADKLPLFISEWGFETGGTEGGDLNFGLQFEAWMRFRNIGWTAWSFDTIWGPRMFNSDWTLKNGTGGEGSFIKDLLIEEHNK
jgi:endoglucanase